MSAFFKIQLYKRKHFRKYYQVTKQFRRFLLMVQQQFNQQLGAHELMDLHEVLTNTIDGINQAQLYTPHVQDQELQSILQNQIRFMTNEYNSIVKTLSNKTQGQNVQSYRTIKNVNPTYGMQGGGTSEKPNTDLAQMNDHDVASGLLGIHKTSAVLRMRAATECVDPELREMMIQGSKNCADQAYEVWNYMNRKGYYQVPTFNQNTTQQIINHYQPATNIHQPVQYRQQNLNSY